MLLFTDICGKLAAAVNGAQASFFIFAVKEGKVLEIMEISLSGTMMYLRELNLASISLRLILSIIFGGIIGIERGRKRHAAGLRTHIVVCMGAALVMMVSQYLPMITSVPSDPARLGAQVISGIGFLGVGTIVVTGHKQVKGLTTAAGLWASACMGLAIGIGFYEGATLMCIALYLVLEVLNFTDEKYLKNGGNMQIYLECASSTRFSSVLKMIRTNGWHADLVEVMNAGGENYTSMLISISHSGKGMKDETLVEGLREIEGVLFVEKM